MQINRYSSIFLAATILVFALIVLGGVVRVTESGGACPDWPTCLGQWTPPTGTHALLDYLHRALTLVAGIVVLIATLLGILRYQFVRQLIVVAILMLVQVIASGLASLSDAWGSWVTTIHLGLALLVFGLLIRITVASIYKTMHGEVSKFARLTFHTPFSRLSLITLISLSVLLASGAFVSMLGSSSTCTNWPLCLDIIAQGGSSAALHLIHRLLGFLSAILIGLSTWHAWKSQRSQTAVLVATTATFVLFFSQALLGARLVQGFPSYLLVLHQVTATAAWAALIIQTVTAGLTGRSQEEENLEFSQSKNRPTLVRDLLLLTKPIVVLLLLVTTYAGMVIGARTIPGLSLSFWTILAGFLAAGGSGAINQYIDRADDQKMQRTQKRPIPSGRLTPGEGLAFGVALCLASFYIMVAYVNLLAAILSLAGIIYYVLLYSVFLKKTTVQNIVIGGGAGALPPLVGWAAATGSLNIPSLFLFAVIFMWTPPHFWALALVRRHDYARAGVPMLPVIRGELETRRQILIYTIELVGLSLFLPIFGLGGAVYFVGASVLGLWLLSIAWRVWKVEGNKVAWKMYRYSSMYLAFIFLVLMIDRLL